MDYFYCLPEKVTDDSILIDGDEFSHLVHVMRKKAGDVVRVVDGEGTAYEVVLENLKKKEARGTIIATYANHNEPVISLTLAVGILKNPSRFDFLVEKVTELGAKEIIPLRTERTIPLHAKVERWQKLALAAMKQCGRGYLPRVVQWKTLNDVVSESSSYDCRLVAHEHVKSTKSLRTFVRKSCRSVLAVIGPEGGFSENEIMLCTSAGCVPFSLGDRRLRTETAAIDAAAQILS